MLIDSSDLPSTGPLLQQDRFPTCQYAGNSTRVTYFIDSFIHYVSIADLH